MTANQYGFESGANGDPLTIDKAWADPASATVVVSGAGSSATISTDHAAHGTRSAKFIAAATSGTCYTQKSISSTTLAITAKVWIDTLPSADTFILWAGNGSSQRFSVELTSTGAIRMRDDANAAKWDGSATTSPATLPTGAWVRIECYVKLGVANGTFRLAAYLGDSTTPISGLDSGTVTAQNTGPDSYTTIRYGAKTSTNANSAALYFDDFDYDEAATGLIGPYVESLPTPAVTITAANPPSTVGGSDGSIVVTWAPVSGAGGYDASIKPGTVSTGFTPTTAGVSSPHTFGGLTAGTYTVAIRATV